MVFLWWCGGVFVVVWWCFCGGVAVVTLPPWNSRKLVHSKEMVWAWRWSVALRTFYRQILALLYTFFSSETSAPGSPGNYLYTATPYTAQTFLLFNRLLCFRDIRRLVWFLIGFCD